MAFAREIGTQGPNRPRRTANKPNRLHSQAPESDAIAFQSGRHQQDHQELHEGDLSLSSTLPKKQTQDNGMFAACSFLDLGLAPALADHMRDRMGFHAPTKIQHSVIPLILSGKDVLVNAETGSGKTISYLAPIVHQLQASMKKITRVDGTFALVLVPTRELCLQVYEVIRQLVHRFHWLVPGYVIGGENRMKEKARLRKGINLLVATPGRLLDHLQHTTSFRLDNLHWLILDEADRLLDLGFGKDIESILKVTGSRSSSSASGIIDVIKSSSREKLQQRVLLSATLNEQVTQLASLSLMDPATVGLSLPLPDFPVKVTSKVRILNSDESPTLQDFSNPMEYRLPSDLSQYYIIVPCSLRLVTLLAILHRWLIMRTSYKVVVFFSTCDAVDFHYALISEFQWSFTPEEPKVKATGFLPSKSFRLHGNMPQQERTATFNTFTGEKSAVLLCTDVAARGLDFPRVSCIIQYDSPGDATEYVHRVGRTARLGQKGEAWLLLQPCELEYLQELQKHGVSLKELQLAKILGDMLIANKKMNNQVAMASLEMHPAAVALQKALETFISRHGSMKHLAVDAFRSYVRAYTTHRDDLKMIFQVKKLHLGHVAKSFGLCDRPSLLGKSSNKQAKRIAKKQEFIKREKKKRRFYLAVRES